MRSIVEVVQNLIKPYIDSVKQALSTTNNVLGAKNLLPNNAVSQTVSGATYTVNSDGTITVSGTASGTNSYINLVENLSLPNGEYVLSCEGADGHVYAYALIGDTRYNTLEGSVNFTINNQVITRVRVVAVNGYPTSPMTLKVMIRPASIQDATYVPYAMTNRELTKKVTPISSDILFGKVSSISDLDTVVDNMPNGTGYIYFVSGVGLIIGEKTSSQYQKQVQLNPNIDGLKERSKYQSTTWSEWVNV